MDSSPSAPRILTDPTNGRQVEIVYALPPQLLPPPETQEGLWDIISMFMNRWRTIALCVLISAGLGVAYALSKPNVYTGVAVALPPSEKSSGMLSQVAGLAAAAGINLPSTPTSSVDAVLAILQSRRLREPLIERFALQAYYKTKTRDDTLKAFENDFIVKHDKRNNTITIAYTHRDPATAAAVVNAAADALSDIFSDIQQNSARRERLFLEERVRSTEAELAVAAKELAAFQAERGTIEIESQTKATIDALARLQGELIGQQIELKALLAAAAAPDNPQVQLIQQRIIATQAEMQRLLSAGEGVLPGLTRLPELGIAFIERYRAVKKFEAVLQALTAQLETARINEVRSMEAVTIIDRASVPERKSGPPRTIICIIATMIGGLLGCTLVYAQQKYKGLQKESA